MNYLFPYIRGTVNLFARKKFEMPIKIWYFIKSYFAIIKGAKNLRLEEQGYENLGE